MRLTFDRFVLDTGTRELCRDGCALALTPKAFEVLEILIGNRPRVVSKTELQERLWPDRFVVDKNLANLVSEVRDALGDDPSAPRFIRTAHRIGYAFVYRDGTTDARPSPALDTRIVRLSWDDQLIALSDGEYVVGRDPGAHLFVESASVSRRHALITVAGIHTTIEDLGSRNGTFIGERRIGQPARLKDGDVIRVGSAVLTVRVLQAPGSTLPSDRHP